MASVHFRTNILLKSVIGKDLITDDNVAVLELVKNSFDANSEGVSIVFKNILFNDDKPINELHADVKKPQEGPTSRTSKILIKDTGAGMTLADLENKWLNIAYSEKKAIRKEFGRVLAGNKGVGRFSCDRLGRYLDIFTRKAGSNSFLRLSIDWKRFEVENEIELNIQDIELTTSDIPVDRFEEITGHKPFPHGTILEISKLRERWIPEKIVSLKRQLEKLINPNQAFKNNPFFIEIIANDYLERDVFEEDYRKINGRVNNKIFENLNFKTSSIYSEIDSQNQSITTTLSHKGQSVFTLVEKNPFLLLQDVKITIYYLNSYSKAYFTRQTGIRSVDFGSISLFINGFRIPPYGDVGDDWLGLEIRKGQGYSRYLGTREIVGRIEINDEDEKFKIISSRTGVVNNAHFEELIRPSSPYGYFFKAFRRLERFVAEGIAFDSAPGAKEGEIEEAIRKAGDKWDESQEVYTEDSLTKNKRILSIISKIIDIKRSDIISLDINEEFVEELVQEEVEQARTELNNIADELANRNLSAAELTMLVERLNSKLEELNSFSSSITTYTGSDYTSSDSSFKEVTDNAYDLAERLKAEIKLLKEQLAEERAQKEIVEAQKRAIEAEHAAEKKRLEDEIEAEKRESLFSKKLAGTDIQEVVNLQHHIDRAADKININITELITHIENKADKPILFKYIDRISLETRKISSIVQFVTNANFNLNATTIKKDLNRFIREYILNVHQEDESLKLNRQLLFVDLKTDNKPIQYSFRPLEIIMVIDNLFSNSLKAKSQHVDISLFVNQSNQLEFIFSDDGPNGIPDEILPRIFNLGFTTTQGSGIGLHHVKQITDRAKATITVDNKRTKGVAFKIVFPTAQ